jgi:taurine--2-oxoglutarate transaminase
MKHNFWGPGRRKNHAHPIAVERAEGVYFWTWMGKRYLDFNSLVMCANVGGCEKRIRQAMMSRLKP